MSHALFVVSEEGYWAEECIEPLTTLEDAGVEVTVVTPSGSPPVVDDRSLDPEDVGEEAADRFRDIHESHPVLRDPEPIAAVEAADYDAVVFPGGHGTVWDITQDRHARQLLLDTVAGDEGVALVVCHSRSSSVRSSSGSSGRPNSRTSTRSSPPPPWGSTSRPRSRS